MCKPAVLVPGVLALVLSAGCSWASMRMLPERPVLGTVDECDESIGWPVTDTAIGVLATVAVAAIAIATVDCLDGTRESGCSTVTIGFLWVPVALSYGLSARRGFKEAKRCRAYHENRLPMLELPPAPVADPADVGKACERIPGVARGGRCPRGLVCRGDTCQP
jgi:hypothetical protein